MYIMQNESLEYNSMHFQVTEPLIDGVRKLMTTDTWR